MNDVFDRLLEHVLREELGAEPAAPELAARVAAAVSAVTVARHVSARTRRSPRLRLAVAAAAAATVVAIAWLAPRSAALECSAPLLAAGADGEPFAVRTRIADGAVAWCAGDADVSLAAADGTALVIAPHTACALAADRRTVELLGGTLELRSQRAPWRVNVERAELVVPAGASVRCVLTPDIPVPPDPKDPQMNPNDLRELLRATTVAAIFTVTVLEGTADLATAQGEERRQVKETLPAGQSRTIRADDDRAAAERARELYQAVRKEAPPAQDEAGMLAAKELDERFHELAISVLHRGAAAMAIRPDVVRDLAGGKLTGGPRSRALQLALLDEEARAFNVASRVWPQVQEHGDFELQVALAERGFEPAMDELNKLAAESRGPLAARALAALAFGGDTSVRDRLERFATRPVLVAERDFQVFDAVCQAKVALAVLGDREAVGQLRSAIVQQGEAWLATGEAQKIALADSCVRRARYYLQQDRPRLSWLELRAQAANGPRTDAPDAASVRAELRSIAPK